VLGRETAMGQRARQQPRVGKPVMQSVLQSDELAIHACPGYFDWPTYFSSRYAGPNMWISLL